MGTGHQPPTAEAFGVGAGEAATLRGPLIPEEPLRPSSLPKAFNPYRPVVFDGRVAVSTGWLVKPVGFSPNRDYPLVVLHSDMPERPDDRSFLVDGRHNLSGHAAQPLASVGFAVLFPGTPPGRVGTATETDAMRANTEAAVRAVAGRGYVDTLRVGVSGFSRSAYYTDQLLMRSSLPFAAATQLDGATAEYRVGMRPYRDDELARIHAPLLAQAHGPTQLAYQGRMADRLRAMGKPAKLLYFQTAPHSTRQPGHRLSSLSTHVDWWRFWLQDHEDPAPEKAAMYARWRQMRAGAKAAPHAPEKGEGDGAPGGLGW